MTASSASAKSPTAQLPALSVAGPHLRLDDINGAAVEALQLHDAARFSASEWLHTDNDDDAHALLERLVQESNAYKWAKNEPPILKYRGVGPTSAAAEVLVSASKNRSDEKIYTITLIRPASPPEPDAVGPGPPRRFASRVPHLDTVASESTAPIPISSSTASGVPAPAMSLTSLNNFSGSDASRTASFSSGYSVSSRKAANRPAVGPERRNLPLSPEMTSMLAHATSLVTDKSHPSTRRELADPDAATSRPAAAPRSRSDDNAPPTNGFPLEDKLPLAVSVLIGRTQSFDRGIEALSDGTDRGAGKPMPFRTPTRGERASDGGDADDDADRDATMQCPSPPAEIEETSKVAEDGAQDGETAPANGEASNRQTLTLNTLTDIVETVPMVRGASFTGSPRRTVCRSPV